ncbi:ABC transporter substrate-binding protein [Gordonia pseudamarae]|nr:ABC transporter substrate-binding protein [Gordonia pseudamarae]
MTTIIVTARSGTPAHMRSLAAVGTAMALALTACGDNPDDRPAAGSTTTVVVLDNNPLGTYNPVNNHGRNGESRIYQGLFRVQPGQPDTQPDITPLLAAGPAVPSDGNRTWTVRTRTGVTFSDGSPFGPDDVVTTYRALINPAVASTELVRWQNLHTVDATGPDEVTFRLKDPSPEFDRLLLTGIAPSERLDAEKATTPDAVPAKDSSLNTDPVGTGPYELTDLRADQAIFEARDDYWGSVPAIGKIVIRHVEDENSRAQQLRNGEGDGTLLDTRLSKAFDNNKDFTVSSRTSADWHAITLPAAHPFVGDQTVRTALNLAIDRQALVDGALDGHGTPNSTFLAPFYGNAYDKSKEIPFDRAHAEKLLDDAGWTRGSDGVRAKDGRRAEFDLIYFTNVGETRKLLALATTSELDKIGVIAHPVAKNSADVSDEDYRTTPLVLGGGSQPYSIDAQLYTVLHSTFAEPGVGAKWDNASDYVNKELDAALDAARVEPDAATRDALYRKAQASYAATPGMLQLAYVKHVYVSRDMGWKEPGVALEPHSHGVEFGPWYTIADWTAS